MFYLRQKVMIVVMILMIVSISFIPFYSMGLRFGKDTSLADVDAIFDGEYGGDRAGTSIASNGDLNGDGLADIVIGAPYNSEAFEKAGEAYVLFGKSGDWSPGGALSSADASFRGEADQNYLGGHPLHPGHQVAIVGDVNGDGRDDMLIGSMSNNEGGNGAGQTYLFFGRTNGWGLDRGVSSADASFVGEKGYDLSGICVAGAGDVNGDGFDDFLIGAMGYPDDSETGKTYLILGRAFGWTMDMDIADASNASFIGEGAQDFSGKYTAGAGDINGDGYDDIIIGAWGNDEGGNSAGQSYIIFGKESGWSTNVVLSNADASFIGEGENDYSGRHVMGVGDINADGLDDIAIGASGDDDGGSQAGKIYIIFGRTSGWAMDTSLSTVSVSFLGEAPSNAAGWGIGRAGDVNGDGFDDMIFGVWAFSVPASRIGKAYLVLGKATGWEADALLSTSCNASFIGESEDAEAGWAVSGAGDINGDGNDDILIGAPGEGAGRIYVIFPENNSPPNSITSLKVYSDISYSTEISDTDLGNTVYVEIQGEDGNDTTRDVALIDVKSNVSEPFGIRLRLYETGPDTGIYRGAVRFMNKTHESHRWIKAWAGETVTISSVQEPSNSVDLRMYSLLSIHPETNIDHIDEDAFYGDHFWTENWIDIKWEFDTDAQWLSWDAKNHTVHGEPNNSAVGDHWVWLRVSHLFGVHAEKNFTLTVDNIPPMITTANVKLATEDMPYIIDYDSDDDGQGTVTWHLETNCTWLDINSTTGNLSGIPTNDDVGTHEVNVSVDDGNGGWDWADFELRVLNTNDAPFITTEPVNTTLEDEYYEVQYSAMDVDVGDINFTWVLFTSGSWLTLNSDGLLFGTPHNQHVGTFYVNITVMDKHLGKGSQAFILEVINVNDPPTWSKIPEPLNIDEGEVFHFDVDALDIDVGDELYYNMSSTPDVGMSIDEATGVIDWKATVDGLGDEPPFHIEVNVTASDGEVLIWHAFNVTINPTLTNMPPRTSLISPSNGSTVETTEPALKWKGMDHEEGKLIFDVYMSTDAALVKGLSKQALIATNVTIAVYNVFGLERGRIYYWTVIPDDRKSHGRCIDLVFSFKVSDTAFVNNPPTIAQIEPQTVKLGERFVLQLEGSDPDNWDIVNMTFELLSPPDDMTIDASSGKISWIPGKNQVGKHTVTVQISDGKDPSNMTFEILVKREKAVSGPVSMGLLLPILLIIMIAVIVLIIVVVAIRKRKGGGQQVQGVPDQGQGLVPGYAPMEPQTYGPDPNQGPPTGPSGP